MSQAQERITYLKYRKVVLSNLIAESLDVMQNGGPLAAFAAERRIVTQDQLLADVNAELKTLLKKGR